VVSPERSREQQSLLPRSGRRRQLKLSPFALRKREEGGPLEVARPAEIGRASVGWPRRNRCDAEPRPRHGLRPNRMLRWHAFVYQRAPLDAKPSRLGRAFRADRPMRCLL
jgi:hypothetical protein